jgi:RHS repeat-associated protein
LFQYAYDANGNMCTKRIATAGTAPDAAFACGSSDTGTTSYSFNPANELSPAPTYQFDANGNQTAMPAEAGRAGLSFAYDVREQTSSITPSGQSALAATYFGPGQFRRTGFGGDSFFEDSLGVGRWTSGSTVTDFTRNPGGTELSESVGGTRYYFAFDGLGSVVGLFSSSGSLVSGYVARYEPYGKLINATPAGYPALPIRFAGYWFDSQTGLYKVGARYYDPVAGRWTQRDPMDNPYDLHGWNRYIYAGDDPINMTDPSGALPVISQRQVRMICRRYPSECRGHNINWRKVGHELEKPTYSAYYGARWLTHHGLFITEAAPLEAQGLLGDMAGDALEGDRACDEGGPGRIPIIHTPIIFPGCHDGHIDP